MTFGNLGKSLHHRIVSNPPFPTPSSRTKASMLILTYSINHLKSEKNLKAGVSISQINPINVPKSGPNKNGFFPEHARVWVSQLKPIIFPKRTKTENMFGKYQSFKFPSFFVKMTTFCMPF